MGVEAGELARIVAIETALGVAFLEAHGGRIVSVPLEQDFELRLEGTLIGEREADYRFVPFPRRE